LGDSGRLEAQLRSYLINNVGILSSGGGERRERI
jgi:hypothetical protein